MANRNSPIDKFSTIEKIVLLTPILRAATLLYDCKLIKVEPNEVVKLFIKKNPDIQEAVSKEADRGNT